MLEMPWDPKKKRQKAQHPAFPRGPPPQYYLNSTRLTSLFEWEAVSRGDVAELIQMPRENFSTHGFFHLK